MKMNSRIILGALLVAGGALLLLQSMGILRGSYNNIFWFVILGFVAVISLSKFFSKRRRWWWLIFGLSALAGMATQGLTLYQPHLGETYSEMILLVVIGLSFIGVYLNDRLQWWAVMPGGIMITLGAVSFVNQTGFYDLKSNAVFFLGMGLTCLFLFLIPTKIGRLKWPIYAAIPLLLVGAFLTYQGQDILWQYAGPAIIILAGLYFFLSSLIRKFAPKKPPKVEPQPEIEVIPPEDNRFHF